MLTMQVIGNLGKQPEVKTLDSGTKLARFSVASNKKIKGEKHTTWVNVTVFDKFKIEFVEKYLNKGDKVFLEGEPQARAYESNGEMQASLDMVVGFNSKLEIMGNGDAGSRDNTEADTGKDEGLEELNDDVPF